jgi:hypothetical protein
VGTKIAAIEIARQLFFPFLQKGFNLLAQLPSCLFGWLAANFPSNAQLSLAPHSHQSPVVLRLQQVVMVVRDLHFLSTPAVRYLV